jgi:hypothetical protein
MKKILDLDIKTLFILILVAILIFKQCGGKKEEVKPVDTVKIDGKKYDVVKKETEIKYVDKVKIVNKKGEDIYHDTTIYVPVPQDVDTVKILSLYHAKNVFKDTLKLDDSLGIVTVVDTIQKNTILNRSFNAKVREKVIRDVVYLKEQPRRQVFIGPQIGLNNQEVLKTLSLGLLYKDKKDKIYHIGAGVINQTPNSLSPVINGGMFWKIQLKK